MNRSKPFRTTATVAVVLLTTLFRVQPLPAQDLARQTAVEICNCVGLAPDMDSLEARIDSCAGEALERVIGEQSDEIQELYSSDATVEELVKSAFELLLPECPVVRQYVFDERSSQYYRLSGNSKALRLYEKGNTSFELGDFSRAIKYYRKSSAKDRGFVMAADMTARCYEMTGDTAMASRYYLKSLEIYPEGTTALKALGNIYTALREKEKAMECYQKMIYFFPFRPDGYFEAGKLLILSGLYAESIDYVFIAHRVFLATGSENATESEKLIKYLHDQLREEGDTGLFERKASEYGIIVDLIK